MKGPSRLAGTLLLGLALAATAATLSCSRGGGTAAPASAEAAIWYCPMHPTVTSDHPGNCPICQMRLVKLERRPAAAPDASAAPESPRIVYRSSMNPNETSDHPGKDSMGMEMVRTEVPAAGPSGIAGWADVDLPPDRLQQSGVTFGTVATKRMAGTIHTSGRVAYDETRIHHVHTKLAGWIEHLEPLSVGDPVRRGDPLFDLYAPELLAAQEEYLQTLRAERALVASSDPDFARAAHALRDAARRRLLLWDFGPDAIARLETDGEASRTVTVRAPISGVITARAATHGLYADPQADLVTIADLSKVWVLADVYENELSLVRPGASARTHPTYAPGRVLAGRIALVAPVLDPATRTAKVRIALDNPSGALRPDMFTDVEIDTDAGDRTVVPKSAVVSTGERSIVFVDRGGGRLSPREVTLGLRFDDDLEVLAGLSPGERIVTSATFVVDSESRLRAAVGGAAPAIPAPRAEPEPPAPGEPR